MRRPSIRKVTKHQLTQGYQGQRGNRYHGEKVLENDMRKFTLSKQYKLYNLVDNVRFGKSWVVFDDGLNGGTGSWGR